MGVYIYIGAPSVTSTVAEQYFRVEKNQNEAK